MKFKYSRTLIDNIFKLCNFNYLRLNRTSISNANIVYNISTGFCQFAQTLK